MDDRIKDPLGIVEKWREEENHVPWWTGWAIVGTIAAVVVFVGLVIWLVGSWLLG